MGQQDSRDGTTGDEEARRSDGTASPAKTDAEDEDIADVASDEVRQGSYDEWEGGEPEIALAEAASLDEIGVEPGGEETLGIEAAETDRDDRPDVPVAERERPRHGGVSDCVEGDGFGELGGGDSGFFGGGIAEPAIPEETPQRA